MNIVDNKIQLTKEELIELLTFKSNQFIKSPKFDGYEFIDNYGEFEWDADLLKSLPIDIMVQAIINTIKNETN